MSNNLRASLEINAGVTGLNQFGELINQIETAGGDVVQLRQRFQQLNSSWDSLSTEQQQQQFDNLRNEINQTGSSLNSLNALNSLDGLINQIETAGGDVVQLRQRFQQLNSTWNTLTTEEQQRQFNNLRNEINQTSDSLRSSGNSAQSAQISFKSLAKSMAMIAGTYIGISAVTSGVMSLVEASKKLDSISQKLDYITDSAGETAETWVYLKDLANELGLENLALADGYAQLASATKEMSMSQDETKETFEGVAKATAAMSLTVDQSNGVFLALAQIASKGKVSMEELRGQLGERLTPAMGIAAKAMGVTTSELIKMVESGINASEFLPKFGAALTEAFGEQSLKNITTTTGAINLLTNKTTTLKEMMLDGWAGEGIASGIQYLSKGIDEVSVAIQNIDPASIEASKQVVLQTAESVKQLATFIIDSYNQVNGLVNAFDGLEESENQVGLLTRAMQGLGIIIGGVGDTFQGLRAVANLTVGGITSAFATLYENLSKIGLLPDSLQEKYAQFADELRKSSDEAFASFDKNVDDFESGFKKALDSTLTTAQDTNAQLKVSYADATAKIIDDFDTVAIASKTTNEDIKKAFESGVDGAKTKEGIDSLVYGMLELQEQGKISGAEMSSAMNKATTAYTALEEQTDLDIKAIAKLAEESVKANDGMISDEVKHEASLRNLSVTVDEVGTILVGMADKSKQSAEDIKTKMADTAQNLGIDFELASDKVTKAMQKSVDEIQLLASNFDELKTGGLDASNALMQGLQNMQETAKNDADFKALIALWQKFGDEGKLSTDQVAAGIDAINEKLAETPKALSETERALKALGIISKENASAMAQEQINAFKLVKESGQASANQLESALNKINSQIEKSGDASLESWYDAEMSAISMGNAVESSANTAVSAMSNAERATDKVTDSINDVSQATRQATIEQKKFNREVGKGQKLKNTDGKDVNMKQYDESAIYQKLLEKLGVDESNLDKSSLNSLKAKASDLNRGSKNLKWEDWGLGNTGYIDKMTDDYAQANKKKDWSNRESSSKSITQSSEANFDKKIQQERERANREAEKVANLRKELQEKKEKDANNSQSYKRPEPSKNQQSNQQTNTVNLQSININKEFNINIDTTNLENTIYEAMKVSSQKAVEEAINKAMANMKTRARI